MKRREFLQTSATALFSAPLIFNNPFSLFSDSSAAHIVHVFDRGATTLNMRPGASTNPDGVIVDKILSYAVNRTRVFNMVDTAVKKLTGRPTVGQAWEALFPAGHPTRETTISIKLNLSYGEREKENDWSKTPCPFGPKAAVSDAIVWGLTQMLDGTFPIENILLFDSAYSTDMRALFPIVQGYRPVNAGGWGLKKDRPEGSYGIHWVTPRHPLEIPADAPRFIAAPDFSKEYQAPQRIIPPAYQSDFTINIANAKTHREGGITGVMKNTFGCTDNPFGAHGTTWKEPDTPYAGSKVCAPAFYKNIHQHSPTILNVLDALQGLYYGGPLSGKVFEANTITISKDPVAIDTCVLNFVNEHRKRNGYSLLTTDEGRTKDGFPHATVLRIAAEDQQLGSMSMDNSYTYDLSDSKEAYDIPVLQNSQSRVSDVYQKRNRYRLDVHLDRSRRRHQIESRIEDIEGNVLAQIKPKSTRSAGTSLYWDHQQENGMPVGAGLYVWHVEVDGIRHTRVINDQWPAG